jgi:hypothetical protein
MHAVEAIKAVIRIWKTKGILLNRRRSLDHRNPRRRVENKIRVRGRSIRLTFLKSKRSLCAVGLVDNHGVDSAIGVHTEDNLFDSILHPPGYSRKLQPSAGGGQRQTHELLL